MHKSEHSTHELARSNGFTDGATDRRYLDIARYEAETSFSEGGIPVGAVLVRNGRRVGQGHNQRVQRGNAILHGEMDCLVNAGRQTTYADTTLYTTLSPCMMCTGTILQFGIPRVVIGENDTFGGNEEFLRIRGVEVVILHDQDCRNLIRRFINAHPEIWAEDIGSADLRGHP